LHELGLMQQVVRILRESVQREGIKKVSFVKLVVGQMTAAQPDSLRFAFEVFSETETWLKGAILEIEEKGVTARCLTCNTIYPVDDYRFACPECAGSNNQIEGGRELYVDYYEGD
jgi:hydrogenase nickel incorporation protein HypA/HybF